LSGCATGSKRLAFNLAKAKGCSGRRVGRET
jgi:hypothetical protein